MQSVRNHHPALSCPKIFIHVHMWQCDSAGRGLAPATSGSVLLWVVPFLMMWLDTS